MTNQTNPIIPNIQSTPNTPSIRLNRRTHQDRQTLQGRHTIDLSDEDEALVGKMAWTS